MSLVEDIQEMVGGAVERLGGMIRRGTISSASTSFFLKVQGFANEFFENVELWQQFGFASVPPDGGEVAIVKPANDGDNAIAIATSDRGHRPSDLAQGESAMYSQSSDQATVKVRSSGAVQIDPGGSEFCEIGGDTDRALKGETTNTDLQVYIDNMVLALATWNGSPKALSDANTLLGIWNTQMGNLQTAAGGPTGTDWLSDKLKTD